MPADVDLTTGRRLMLAGLVGCGLIFGSTLATSALWRSAVSLDGGTLGSGSVVLLNGSAGSQVKNYAFTALTGSALKPGSTVQAPLVMRNGGSSPLGYRLNSTGSTGASSLSGELSLRLDVVTGSCTTGVGAAAPAGITSTPYDGTLLGATTSAPRLLAPGATETLCVRVGVRAAAPRSASGATTSIIFTFGAQPA